MLDWQLCQICYPLEIKLLLLLLLLLLISCLHLPTFRSQVAIVSEKSIFIFSNRKALVSKFDLAVK